MDSGSARVEIELESHGPDPVRRRGQPRPDRPDESAEIEDRPPSGSGRPATVALVVAVTIVAALAGWAVGRAGSDGDAAPATSSVTSPAPTTAAPATTDAVSEDTLPAAELPPPPDPPTTPQRATAVTDATPTWETSTVPIDPRLAGQTDRLVATTFDGELVELDLGTGTARAIEVPDAVAGQALYPPVAGDDWVLVRTDGEAYRYSGDSAVGERVPVGLPWALAWEYGTDRFWAAVEPAGDSTLLEEYDVVDGPTGRSLDIGPLFLLRSDPAGGVVVGSGAAGFYTADVGRSAPLGGFPVAMSAGHVVVYTCGDSIEACGLRLVDRATGQWRPIASESGSNRYTEWFSTAAVPAITSDAGAAMFASSSDDGEPVMVIVDLTTGEEHRFGFTDLDGSGFMSPTGVWSTDERFAYVLGGGALVAFDRTTGESFPVVRPTDEVVERPELLRLAAITIRVAT